MRVLVFGGGGWLGRAVLAALEPRHHVIGVDHSDEAWEAWSDLDGPWRGDRRIADIRDWPSVEALTAEADRVVHLSVYFGQEAGDPLPWLINLQGLWNVLESARRRGIRRVVHVGSREATHPAGIFFDADARRPGGGIYPLTKLLQEEMCRSFWAAHRLRTLVLCPDYIVDSRIGLGRFRERLGPPEHRCRPGWVCRHDLAEGVRLAVENDALGFDIFHIVGTPESDATCNVARSRDVLGLVYRGNLDQYR